MATRQWPGTRNPQTFRPAEVAHRVEHPVPISSTRGQELAGRSVSTLLRKRPLRGWVYPPHRSTIRSPQIEAGTIPVESVAAAHGKAKPLIRRDRQQGSSRENFPAHEAKA